MAATDKLVVFNDVLRELSSHPLADLATANTRLQELNGAFPHAVEYMLAKREWNFARRRATLSGVADVGFPPFTYRYARPADYLRKVWVKKAPADEFQIEHAEVGAVLYGFERTAVMEYMSDHADNYTPANWPPQFTRGIVVYLALLVGPKIARLGDDGVKRLYGILDEVLASAERLEAVHVTNERIPAERAPVMRRAIEFMGQQLGGSSAIAAKADELRGHMQRSWGHALRYLLEQGAWNFATKRALLTTGLIADEIMPGGEYASILEGYSVDGDPATAAELPRIAGFSYGFYLPDDYVHKIWLKPDATSAFECAFQLVRDMVFTNTDPCVLEYVGSDDWIEDPTHWPATFSEAMSAYLAVLVAPELVVEDNGRGGRVAPSRLRDTLEAQFARKLSEARNKDAVQQGVQRMPSGRFVRARLGGGGMRGTH